MPAKNKDMFKIFGDTFVYTFKYLFSNISFFLKSSVFFGTFIFIMSILVVPFLFTSNLSDFENLGFYFPFKNLSSYLPLVVVIEVILSIGLIIFLYRFLFGLYKSVLKEKNLSKISFIKFLKENKEGSLRFFLYSLGSAIIIAIAFIPFIISLIMYLSHFGTVNVEEPEAISTLLFKGTPVAVSFAITLILVLYLAIKLVYVLPVYTDSYLKNKAKDLRFFDAVKMSFRIAKGKKWWLTLFTIFIIDLVSSFAIQAIVTIFNLFTLFLFFLAFIIYPIVIFIDIVLSLFVQFLIHIATCKLYKELKGI